MNSGEGKQCFVVHLVMWHFFKPAKHCLSCVCVCVPVHVLYSQTMSVKPGCASQHIGDTRLVCGTLSVQHLCVNYVKALCVQGWGKGAADSLMATVGDS